MTKKKIIMLRRDWVSPFTRCVRKQSGKNTGKILEVLTFEPGVPRELNDAQYKAVEGDIGKCLQEVTLDEEGRARVVISDKDREEAALAMAQKGKEIESLTSQVVELQKAVEDRDTTIVELQGKVDTLEAENKELDALLNEEEQALEEEEPTNDSDAETDSEASEEKRPIGFQ